MKKASDLIKRAVALTTLLAAIAIVAITANAQNPNVVFKGVVTSQGNGYFVVRNEQGLRHQVLIDDNTHFFKDGPEFSIANIDKLVLQRSNIKIGNRVEIVARNGDDGYHAGIVTVMTPGPQWKQTLAKK
jgi:hypothetical protein